MPTYHLAKDKLNRTAVDDLKPVKIPDLVEPPASSLAPPMAERIRDVQAATDPGAGRQMRRLAFVWFRIYVWEKSTTGKQSQVNLRIPIPIPVVGAFLRRHVTNQQALKLLSAAEGPDGYEALDRLAESLMGFELIRVEETKRGKHEIVVIGFD